MDGWTLLVASHATAATLALMVGRLVSRSFQHDWVAMSALTLAIIGAALVAITAARRLPPRA